jgi:hypothetical protein
MASKADRIWHGPTSVGRKPRRAEGVPTSPRAERAGFEPCRGSGFSHEYARPQTLGPERSSTNADRTPRLKSGAESTLRDSGHPGRAEIFALPGVNT